MSALPSKLAFVDVETTGGRSSDRIIDIGILKVENGELVETYNTLLNPNLHVPEEITALTGILPTQLENAPTFGQVKKEIYSLLDDAVFVAHNVRFDYNFLRSEFAREEITFKAKNLCTVKLSKTLFPTYRHHNLDSIIERHGFKIKNRHRAFDDAQILWEFYQYILKNFSEDLVQKAVSFVLKQPARPININPEIITDLPEAPGVYIFYGSNGLPLYIGKSVNIKERVMSHFSSDKNSPTEAKIAQQIESIEVIQTAGELGALFLESQLIKKMMPLYNRMLRYSRMMIVLKRVSKNGYDSVVLESADTIDVNKPDEVLGIFKNKKSAKLFLTGLSKEFELCEKLLGVENTLVNCFGYRLGRCQGACSRKEEPKRYNMRFAEAFSKTKFKQWPFDGPILIQEKDELTGKLEGFLIDKWCYLGTIKNEDQLLENETLREFSFDVDTYKILLRYISNPKNRKNIKLVKKLNPTQIKSSDWEYEQYPEVST